MALLHGSPRGSREIFEVSPHTLAAPEPVCVYLTHNHSLVFNPFYASGGKQKSRCCQQVVDKIHAFLEALKLLQLYRLNRIVLFLLMGSIFDRFCYEVIVHLQSVGTRTHCTVSLITLTTIQADQRMEQHINTSTLISLTIQLKCISTKKNICVKKSTGCIT